MYKSERARFVRLKPIPSTAGVFVSGLDRGPLGRRTHSAAVDGIWLPSIASTSCTLRHKSAAYGLQADLYVFPRIWVCAKIYIVCSNWSCWTRMRTLICAHQRVLRTDEPCLREFVGGEGQQSALLPRRAPKQLMRGHCNQYGWLFKLKPTKTTQNKYVALSNSLCSVGPH